MASEAKGQALVLVDALDERGVVALVIGGDDAARSRGGCQLGHAWMVPGRDRVPSGSPFGQPPLSPVPRHDTFGFQSAKAPFGFLSYSQ
jgi:hypothetical protein